MGRTRFLRVLSLGVLATAALATAGAAHAHPSRDVAIEIDGPASARQGDNVSYVVTVRNVGHEPVSGIAVAVTRPGGWEARSVKTTQGGCSTKTTCELGSLAAGETASASIILWAGTDGAATISAGVAAEADEDSSNDSDTISTSVATARCRAVVRGGPLEEGVDAVLATSVTLAANPVPRRRIVGRRAGASAAARTDARGRARLRVRAETAGAVVISLPSLRRCRARLPVLAARDGA